MHCKDVHELCLEHSVTAVDCMKQVISTSHMCGHCLFDFCWDLAAAGKVMSWKDISALQKVPKTVYSCDLRFQTDGRAGSCSSCSKVLCKSQMFQRVGSDSRLLHSTCAHCASSLQALLCLFQWCWVLGAQPNVAHNVRQGRCGRVQSLEPRLLGGGSRQSSGLGMCLSCLLAANMLNAGTREEGLLGHLLDCSY